MPSKPNETSETELSLKLIPDLKPLTISAKRYILGAWLGSEYSSVSNITNFWCT